MSVKDRINAVRRSLPSDVKLIAVSKTHPAQMIAQAYDAGQRAFGENRPQELREKYELLPRDIEWHFIGGLQTNKVKYIAPLVAMIHSADSAKLLSVIDKEAAKNNRVIDVLLEIYVAQEDTKQGWAIDELRGYLAQKTELPNVRFRGVMGMATFTDDKLQIEKEFTTLRQYFDELKRDFFVENADFDTLSMGMSGDLEIAIKCGSTMVRIGSTIFGNR